MGAGRFSRVMGIREFLYFFTWRDVKFRYKQTGLGIGWAVIQPLLMMVIFSVFFGRLAKIPSDERPLSIICTYCPVALDLFAEGMTRSTVSMVANANIMTKVYFPRLIMPIASILSPLVDLSWHSVSSS